MITYEKVCETNALATSPSLRISGEQRASNILSGDLLYEIGDLQLLPRGGLERLGKYTKKRHHLDIMTLHQCARTPCQ